MSQHSEKDDRCKRRPEIHNTSPLTDIEVHGADSCTRGEFRFASIRHIDQFHHQLVLFGRSLAYHTTPMQQWQQQREETTQQSDANL